MGGAEFTDLNNLNQMWVLTSFDSSATQGPASIQT